MDWLKSVQTSITVCDSTGMILYMNERAIKTFEKDGGAALVGKNLMDCHPAPAAEKLLKLMEQKTSNTYSIEKNGVKKLIHQAPWFDEGRFGGLVEFSIELPAEIPHFLRK
jgi:transcriptional regulator with PAS, ATPase and Fis domain